MKWWLKLLLGLAVISGLVYLYYTEVKPVVIFGLRSEYAHAIPFQKIPEGLTSLKAESCGQCHREIYEEWKTSIHAHAYEDPFFQAYWKKDKQVWVCLNCHTPLENQQPTLVKDIPRGRVEKATQEPNPHFDAAQVMDAMGSSSAPSTIRLRRTRPNLTRRSAPRSFVRVATMWSQVLRSSTMWGPAARMRSMKENISCRSGALSAKAATCRRWIAPWPRTALSGGGAGISGAAVMIPTW